jgi:hypothetical protein
MSGQPTTTSTPTACPDLFAAPCQPGLYVAVTREARQAGRLADGKKFSARKHSRAQMAARLAYPRRQGTVQAARRDHRAGVRPAIQPARPQPQLPRRQDRPRTAPVGRNPQLAQSHPRPPALGRNRGRHGLTATTPHRLAPDSADGHRKPSLLALRAPAGRPHDAGRQPHNVTRPVSSNPTRTYATASRTTALRPRCGQGARCRLRQAPGHPAVDQFTNT